MNRIHCLQKAIELTTKERHNEYGEAMECLGKIAALWSIYTKVKITAKDVALMMGLLKIVRAQTSKDDDSLVDLCGYGALACEIKSKEEKKY